MARTPELKNTFSLVLQERLLFLLTFNKASLRPPIPKCSHKSQQHGGPSCLQDTFNKVLGASPFTGLKWDHTSVSSSLIRTRIWYWYLLRLLHQHLVVPRGPTNRPTLLFFP